MKIRTLLLLFFFGLLGVDAASAHEVRPAYLELREAAPGEFAVLWKTPMRGDMRLGVSPEFSGRTETLTPVETREAENAALQTWRLRAVDPLRGQSVRIAGLEGTMTDALIRVEFADGTSWTQRLTPGQPAAVIPVRQSGFAVAGVYLTLGVEHILLGIDHLLFVLALLLITRGGWKLFKTVTAFTVAHSITLSAATLGFVHVPQAPVEAVIALSIVFVAAELVRLDRGASIEGRVNSDPSSPVPLPSSLTARAPWIVAFTFGLLHGFGFAGALSEVGLPQGQIPVALLFFNLGVEAGQLMFIAAALSFIAVIRRMRIPSPRWTELIPAYAIGTLAMFWVIQRIMAF
ncbi:MAG TPA: HupE/UreJ family protein [Nitrospiria bacterium]|nr:HupE/UreJ family protein [Nitrospiria bacterium]